MRMFAENPMNPGFHRIFSKHAKILSMENGDPVMTWSLENMQKLWVVFENPIKDKVRVRIQ